jgi:small nuclear ribonucleoprotein (snRNP)-like protein
MIVEKMLVLLRDGRKLMGVLRSYDQFGKLFPLSSSRPRFSVVTETRIGVGRRKATREGTVGRPSSLLAGTAETMAR